MSQYTLFRLFFVVYLLAAAADSLISEQYSNLCPDSCSCIQDAMGSSLFCKGSPPKVIPVNVLSVTLLSTEDWTCQECFIHDSWTSVLNFTVLSEWQNSVTINNNTFSGLDKLQSLSFSGASGEDWDGAALRHLQSLEHLSLANSHLLMLDKYTTLVFSLPNASLKTLNASRTNRYRNLDGRLLNRQFFDMWNTHPLEILDISYTGTLLVSSDVIEELLESLVNFDTLKELYLSGTVLLRQGEWGSLFSWELVDKLLPNLRKIVYKGLRLPLGINDISRLTGDCCRKKPYEICNDELYNNDVRAFPNITEIDVSDSSMLPRNILACYIHMLTEIPYLRTIVARNNSIMQIHVGLDFIPSLENLDLRGNSITYLIPTIFKGLHNIRRIDLANNRLGSDESDSLQYLFIHSKNLEHVDLSENSIRRLSSGMFSNNHKMGSLILSYNNMDMFSLRLDNMPELSFVDLRGNRISVISDVAMADLTYLMHVMSHPLLDLHHNHIVCSCESKQFVSRLQNLRSAFIDWRTMSCFLKGNEVSLSDVKPEQLQILCLEFLWKIILPCVVVIGLMILLAYFCYRKRLYFIGLYIHFRFWRYRKSVVDAVDRIFVAYCQDDQDFVVSNMFPKVNPKLMRLLGTKSDVLYFSDKDFGVGTDIDTEIVTAILACRCTVVVVSEKCIDSPWLNLETCFTWNHNKPLIPIYLDKIEKKRLPGVLRYYYDKKSRLLYPNDGSPANEELFWQSFLASLSSVFGKNIQRSGNVNEPAPAIANYDYIEQRETCV